MLNLKSICTSSKTEGKSLIISWTIMMGRTFIVSPMKSSQANTGKFISNSQGV